MAAGSPQGHILGRSLKRAAVDRLTIEHDLLQRQIYLLRVTGQTDQLADQLSAIARREFELEMAQARRRSRGGAARRIVTDDELAACMRELQGRVPGANAWSNVEFARQLRKVQPIGIGEARLRKRLATVRKKVGPCLAVASEAGLNAPIEPRSA